MQSAYLERDGGVRRGGGEREERRRRGGGEEEECERNNTGPYDLSRWERSSSFLVPGLS